MKIKIKEDLKDKDYLLELPNKEKYVVMKELNLQANYHKFYYYLYKKGIEDNKQKQYLKLFQDKINEIYYIDLEII